MLSCARPYFFSETTRRCMIAAMCSRRSSSLIISTCSTIKLAKICPRTTESGKNSFVAMNFDMLINTTQRMERTFGRNDCVFCSSCAIDMRPRSVASSDARHCCVVRSKVSYVLSSSSYSETTFSSSRSSTIGTEEAAAALAHMSNNLLLFCRRLLCTTCGLLLASFTRIFLVIELTHLTFERTIIQWSEPFIIGITLTHCICTFFPFLRCIVETSIIGCFSSTKYHITFCSSTLAWIGRPFLISY